MSSPRKIVLQSSDNQQFEIDEAVALMSQTIKPVIEDVHADNVLIIPLPNVTGMILAKVIEYCKKRVESGLTEAATGEDITDRGVVSKIWNRPKYRGSLTPDAVGAQGDWAAGMTDISYQVANYLEINGLLDLTYQAVADIIEEGTPEEIRKTLNLETDFT